MKKRILVVDDNKELVNMLKEYFSDNEKIQIVDEAHDGEEAVNKILSNKDSYDLIVLDLIMPKKDGLYVLDKLKENKVLINTIVLTSYNQEETTRKVSEYNVKYMILKPFDLEELENRILSSFDKIDSGRIIDFNDNKEEMVITKLLHDLGMPSNIKGYHYIRDAVNYVYKDSSLIGAVTKQLYPMIGKKYDVSVTRVERAIRHAIEVSWNRADWDLMEEIFGHSVDIDRAKPTNSEFIVTLADKLKLERVKIS